MIFVRKAGKTMERLTPCLGTLIYGILMDLGTTGRRSFTTTKTNRLAPIAAILSTFTVTGPMILGIQRDYV